MTFWNIIRLDACFWLHQSAILNRDLTVCFVPTVLFRERLAFILRQTGQVLLHGLYLVRSHLILPNSSITFSDSPLVSLVRSRVDWRPELKAPVGSPNRST